MNKIDVSRLFLHERKRKLEEEPDDIEDEIEMPFFDDNDDEPYDTYDDDLGKEPIEILESIIDMELHIASCSRGYLKFKHNGTLYRAVPMAKIKKYRYVFEIVSTKELKAFNLSEMQVLK